MIFFLTRRDDRGVAESQRADFYENILWAVLIQQVITLYDIRQNKYK